MFEGLKHLKHAVILTMLCMMKIKKMRGQWKQQESFAQCAGFVQLFFLWGPGYVIQPSWFNDLLRDLLLH